MSVVFEGEFCDWVDRENKTGTCPGFRLSVEQKNEFVGVALQHKNADPRTCEQMFTAALTVEEAEELIEGLCKAVQRAKEKW